VGAWPLTANEMGTLLSNKSGSMKERTQTTTWQQPISLSSAAGRCAGRGCAL